MFMFTLSLCICTKVHEYYLFYQMNDFEWSADDVLHEVSGG